MYPCPVAIALQLHYIDNNITLSKESLQRLKLFFERNDSIARVAYEKGSKLEDISLWYYPTMDTLLTFLTPIESNDMMVNIKEKYSLKNSVRAWALRKIIFNRKNLDFDKTTVDRLLTACSDLEHAAINEKISSKIERDSLVNILSEQQLKKYFNIQVQAQVRKTVLEQMDKLKKNGLYINEEDGGKLYLKLFRHEIEAKEVLEYMNFLGDSKGTEKERLKTLAKRPLESLRLESLNSSSNDLLMDVLCKCAVTGLNEQQVEKLLQTYRRVLEADYEAQYVLEEKFNRGDEQKHYLEEILSTTQISLYFEHICKEGATKKAQKDWDEMKECKTFPQKDNTDILPQLINYEIKLAVTNKWISLNKTREHLFAKEEIINNRPQILTDFKKHKREMKEKEVVRF